MGYTTMKQRIKEKYEDLSVQEKKVAKYIIDNYHNPFCSPLRLAQQAGVSNTAVIRFAKDLGFHGFLEYRKEIRKEYTPINAIRISIFL